MHKGSEHMIFHQINQLASTTRSNQHYQQPTSTSLRLRDKNWIQEMNQGLRGDVAGEDVDGDCPLPMIGALVMTMAMISPSRREVFPAEQLCRSPRLVPPRGGGVLSRKLAHDFSSGKRLHIAKDVHRRTNRGPTRQGGAPPPSWTGGGSPDVFLPLSIFYYFQK